MPRRCKKPRSKHQPASGQTPFGTYPPRSIFLLADIFGLYLKTKNFHWHMSGPHFRDYHLLLDDQATQIFATTDDIAERVRKIGGTTLHSIGEISRAQRILDNDAGYVTPQDMLAELREDNKQLTANMRETHDLCDEHRDVATASLLENWIGEAERRTWFLFEATRTWARPQPAADSQASEHHRDEDRQAASPHPARQGHLRRNV
jgi:starvation-inducible DNA-binding protein